MFAGAFFSLSFAFWLYVVYRFIVFGCQYRGAIDCLERFVFERPVMCRVGCYLSPKDLLKGRYVSSGMLNPTHSVLWSFITRTTLPTTGQALLYSLNQSSLPECTVVGGHVADVWCTSSRNCRHLSTELPLNGRPTVTLLNTAVSRRKYV